MTEFAAQTAKATETYITAVTAAQDEIVKAVAEFVKNIPALPAGFDFPKADLPGFDIPQIDLPTPAEVTTVAFDFTEKLVDRQRDFTQQLIAALTPAA